MTAAAAFDFGEAPDDDAPAPATAVRLSPGADVRADFEALRPAGGFEFIMADPPWSFANFSAKGEAKNAKAHYACMDIAAICALPVSVLAARDCVLWLFATHPMWPEALDCLRAWGFTYKSGGVWAKRTVHGKDAFGTGYIFRTSSEPVLIGTRGAPKTGRGVRSTIASYEGHDLRPGAGWADVVINIEAPTRAHSQKPEAAYAAAEAMMPDARRLELFSRTNRPGWSAWGDEVGKFDEARVSHAMPVGPAECRPAVRERAGG